MLKRTLLDLAKELSYRTGLFRRTFFSLYPFMFPPSQLMFIAETFRDTRGIAGCCLEVGCAYGATTVFLNKVMAEEGFIKDYVALDTFSGFVPEQIDFEVAQRKKRPGIRKAFLNNKRVWYEATLQSDGVSGVRSIVADAAKFDYKPLGPIAFCLLDVDLYIPIRDALPKIYRQMSPGGVIVVDDCSPGGDWDGALQAYHEFCVAERIAVDIRCGRFGVIRKPSA